MHACAADLLKILPDATAGCVLTDIRMPGMTGVELQRKLKHIQPDLPVVVIAGGADIGLAVEVSKAGASDFIEKPFRAKPANREPFFAANHPA